MQVMIDLPEVTLQEVRWRGLYLCPRDRYALEDAIKNAVPVVRCKDCKHWCTDSTPCIQDADVHFCAVADFDSTADWFCANGERRDT